MIAWPSITNFYDNNYPTTFYVQTPIYSSAVCVQRDPRVKAREERERRRVVVHMPPPVILELCTKPLPEKRVHLQPRGVVWLAQAQSGTRERRPIRSRIERKDKTLHFADRLDS